MNGLREGPGEEQNEKGDKFNGHFFNDQKDGEGILIFRDKKRMEGNFKCGDLV